METDFGYSDDETIKTEEPAKLPTFNQFFDNLFKSVNHSKISFKIDKSMITTNNFGEGILDDGKSVKLRLDKKKL
jgi:hypothetical protein